MSQMHSLGLINRSGYIWGCWLLYTTYAIVIAEDGRYFPAYILMVASLVVPYFAAISTLDSFRPL